MVVDQNVMLVTQTRVKPDMNDKFDQLLKKMSTSLTHFSGYISQDIKQPNPPLQLDWILIHYFVSIDAVKAWLQSQERQNLLKEAMPLLVGIDNVYIMEQNHHDQSGVAATITTKVDAQHEQQFLSWQVRVAALQSKCKGFQRL